MNAVFLDRDGMLIVDPPDEVVDSVKKIQLIPETLEALKLLATLDYGVILISNQIGISKGRLTEDDFQLELLKSTGIKILKTYFCTYAPEDNCDCRKPKPGMLMQAAKEFDVDLVNSYMVGDRLSDVQVGINAGTKTIILQTGLKRVITDLATHNASNILDAIKYIAAKTS